MMDHLPAEGSPRPGETAPGRERGGAPGPAGPLVWYVRRAAARDVPELAAIEKDSHRDPWGLRGFEEELARGAGPASTSRVWVAFPASSAGRHPVCGYIIFRWLVDEIYIVNLTTAPEFRRRNIARTLLAAALAWAKRRGARRAVLDVRADNVPAVSLYRRFGFTMAVPGRIPAGHAGDAVVMTLDLDANHPAVMLKQADTQARKL